MCGIAGVIAWDERFGISREILGAMSVLEFVSIAFGRSVRPGSAVAAAQVAAMESFGLIVPASAGAGA